MRMNIRWIHFVLLLLLVLGGYSGLSGQSTEETAKTDPYAEPKGLPESIEPASQKKKPTTGKKYAICYTVDPITGDEFRQSGCTVYFFNGYYIKTGGHEHNSPDRTKGQRIPTKYDPVGTRADSISEIVVPSDEDVTLSPGPTYLALGFGRSQHGRYEGTGGFPFELKPSQVGQEEWVRACNGPPNPLIGYRNCRFDKIKVKYSDLHDYSGTIKSQNTMVPEGTTTIHPDNHYGTTFLTERITKIAKKYRDEFSCYKTAPLKYQPIAINDMALPYGGVFDVKQPTGTDWRWRGPHYSHHRGKAVDIRCHPTNPNSVIHTDDNRIFERFLEICDEEGLDYVEHELEGKAGEHCHCGINRAGE